MKQFLVSYEVKRKGLLPLQSNASEYAESKQKVRELYKLIHKGYKITNVEEIE